MYSVHRGARAMMAVWTVMMRLKEYSALDEAGGTVSGHAEQSLLVGGLGAAAALSRM